MELLTSPVVILIIVGAALVFGPIIALFAFGSLALFIWSFRRIWPFLAGIGRWGANWRNFVPFFGLVFVVATIFVLLALYGPIILRIIVIVLLLIVLPIFLFVFVLALVVWVVRLFRLIRLAIS
jgi:hypothetical protein